MWKTIFCVEVFYRSAIVFIIIFTKIGNFRGFLASFAIPNQVPD